MIHDKESLNNDGAMFFDKKMQQLSD
jgi:hypothetical protein